jgi:hypothetical protein
VTFDAGLALTLLERRVVPLTLEPTFQVFLLKTNHLIIIIIIIIIIIMVRLMPNYVD